MMNTELEIIVDSIAVAGLTALLERIADTYRDGLRIAKPAVAHLVDRRLVIHSRGRARLTEVGWSVATRIAAKRASLAAAAAGPGWWRS